MTKSEIAKRRIYDRNKNRFGWATKLNDLWWQVDFETGSVPSLKIPQSLFESKHRRTNVFVWVDEHDSKTANVGPDLYNQLVKMGHGDLADRYFDTPEGVRKQVCSVCSAEYFTRTEPLKTCEFCHANLGD